MTNKTTAEGTQLKQFLDTLFECNDLIELRCIETWQENDEQKSRVRRRYWLTKDAIYNESKLEELRSLNIRDAANIFFGVCPRPAKNCGKSKDISIIRCFWADVDDCDMEEAKKRVRETSLPEPSITVDSGHGVHLYWLLSEPLIVKGEKHRQEIQTIIKAIQQVVGGDHTQDLARLLRLPGFMNVKRVRNGVKPVACKIATIESEKCYPLDVFFNLVTKSEPEVKASVNANGYGDTSLGRALMRLDEASIGERSEVDFGACCECIKTGLNKEDAWSLVRNKSKFAERGRDYFESVWESASKEIQKGSLGKLIESSIPSTIDVLGMDENSNIVIWAKDVRRISRIPKLREVDTAAMVQIAGRKALKETEAKINEVKVAIAEASRKRVFYSNNCIGQGIRQIQEVDGI